jgi:hypothetical protein
MKNKICIILATILLAIIIIFIYWFKRGDACLAQPPYFNCHTQNKFEEIDRELIDLSGQIGSLNEPSIFSVDKNEGVFSFEHIKNDQTRIIKNGKIKDSLELYTNYIDPTLTPLSENTLIVSAWQWPHDSKLYNGPFFNYYLDFRNGKTIELLTKGRLVAKSQDGKKAVFLESSCVKEQLQEDRLASCNNLDLSLRLVNLTSNSQDIMINHYYAINQWFDQGPPYVSFLDFGKAAFSPNGTKLAIEIKIKEIDHNTSNEYWTLFVADTKTGEIVEKNNRLSKNRYKYVYWLDNEDIIYR